MKTSPNKLYEYIVTGSVFVMRASVDMESNTDSILVYERYAPKEKIINDVLNLLDDIPDLQRKMRRSYEFGELFDFDDAKFAYYSVYDELGCSNK